MTDKTVPKITIDSNCVVGIFDRTTSTATSVEELRELMRYALSGVVQIAVTTRVEVDFKRDRNDIRRGEMLDKITMLPVVGSVWRVGQTKIGGSDMIAGAEQHGLVDEVQGIVFPGLKPGSGKYPNKVADIDHLVGHKLARRDIFVTDDKGILRRKEQLRDGPGIRVMSPAECLDFVDAYYSRQKKNDFTPTRGNERYWNRRLKGMAIFDYSNNDHQFSIGEGLNLFETRWSKASDKRIHAYRESPSVREIALATGANEIRDIIDATAYDYSSRIRTPNVGQIVLWRNVNDIYAATKILQLKDATRGADHDEVAFEFVILPDGSTDFSGV